MWIRTGNYTSAELEQILRNASGDIAAFLRDPDATFLELGC
ncbi:MAG: hypothetical protein ACYC7A_18105 [Thermoanaerobaculia bacterium]